MFWKLSLKILFFCLLPCFLGFTSSPDSFRGEYENLLKIYQRQIDENPRDLDKRLEFAGFCYDFRDYERVERILSRESGLSARELLAKALTRQGKYTLALEVFSQIEKDLSSPEAVYLYGYVLEEKNLYPKAIEIYSEVPPPFKNQARKRLSGIKLKVEQNSPEEIRDICLSAGNFLKEIDDEAAVILLADEEIEITGNNTATVNLHVIKKILKERGKDLGEIEIGYDSTYERVELEFARTINQPDKMTYAGKENIRDVSRYLNFPLYSNARAFIISMPAVEVGSIIEYKVKLFLSKLVNEEDFSFSYRLREKYPVYKAMFKVIVPKDRKVRLNSDNHEYARGINLSPKISGDKEKTSYSWEFREILPIIPEENMPPYSFVNPAVFISSFESWQEIYDWWKNLYKDKLSLSGETKNIISELTAGDLTDYEKAKKIYEYVAREIRYVAVEYGDSGYEPHKAEDVLSNRYGDCKDQAILLTAMLRCLGMESYPVLIPTRKAYDMNKDFPSLRFNHAICAVKIKNGLVFMDPTSETTVFGEIPTADQDRTVLVFTDNDWLIEKTPVFADSGFFFLMDIFIEDNENAVINREVFGKGIFAAYHRWYFMYTHPLKIKEGIERKMTEISPFSTLIDYQIEGVEDFDNVPRLKYSFRAERFLNKAGSQRIISALGQSDLRASDMTKLIAKKQRNFPVDFQSLFFNRSRIKINIPLKWRITHLPENKEIDNDWFRYERIYKKPEGDKCLDLIQEFRVKKQIVDKKDYGTFRKELKEVLFSLKEEIILGEQGEAK